jgi:hypothetical protein
MEVMPEASKVGTTMEAGSSAPYCIRYAIMDTGISCKEERFRIIKEHIISEASSLFPDKDCMLFIAWIPDGVAAEPRPRKLAMRLMAIYFWAGWKSGISGNRKRRNGCNFLARTSKRPDLSAIFIIPFQRARIPAMVIQTVMASWVDSMMAVLTLGIVPLYMEKAILNRIIAIQIQSSIMTPNGFSV